MKQQGSLIWISLLTAGLIFGCQSEYSNRVKTELRSGERNDSIFFGIKFGQSKKAFHDYHWELNRSGLVQQGPKNVNVMYILTASDSTESNISMLYYPAFADDDKTYEITGEFYYNAWAPWNEKYQSDQLIHTIQDTLVSWFGGNEFVKVKSENELWAKVDGNRQIALFEYDDQVVKFTISDLTHEED